MISFLDSDRVWFKSAIGFAVTEVARGRTFCEHAVLGRELLVIPDAAEDPRFCSNPLVTSEPHIRFYAGVPLFSREGHALGTLCVIDRVGRQLLPGQIGGPGGAGAPGYGAARTAPQAEGACAGRQ